MNGKGDAPRPYSVSQDQFARNWQRAFRPLPTMNGVRVARRPKNTNTPEEIALGRKMLGQPKSP
jgi:hypothetical protein